jgi:hypothetical protein
MIHPLKKFSIFNVRKSPIFGTYKTFINFVYEVSKSKILKTLGFVAVKIFNFHMFAELGSATVKNA